MDKIIATSIVGAFAGRWQHHLSQDYYVITET